MPLATIHVTASDGNDYAVQSAFAVIPVPGDTLRYPAGGGRPEVLLNVTGRVLSLGRGDRAVIVAAIDPSTDPSRYEPPRPVTDALEPWGFQRLRRELEGDDEPPAPTRQGRAPQTPRGARQTGHT